MSSISAVTEHCPCNNWTCEKKEARTALIVGVMLAILAVILIILTATGNLPDNVYNLTGQPLFNTRMIAFSLLLLVGGATAGWAVYKCQNDKIRK